MAIVEIFVVFFVSILLVAFSFQKCLKNIKIKKIGLQGEEDIRLVLDKLNKNKYHVINNIMLKHSNGKTSQIDHIVISRKGIFVIETKNYSGVLKGNIQKEWWTHVCGKNKHVVYNIVYQNQGHVKAVKNNISEVLTKDLVKDIGYKRYEKLFFSVLVFRDSTILKLRRPFFVFLVYFLVGRKNLSSKFAGLKI